MSFRDSRRALRALALTAVVSGTSVLAFSAPAHALPLDRAAGSRGDQSFTAFFTEVRSLWLSLWKTGTGSGAQLDNGMFIDPHGSSSGTGSGAQPDNGVLIDPTGG